MVAPFLGEGQWVGFYLAGFPVAGGLAQNEVRPAQTVAVILAVAEKGVMAPAVEFAERVAEAAPAAEFVAVRVGMVEVSGLAPLPLPARVVL